MRESFGSWLTNYPFPHVLKTHLLYLNKKQKKKQKGLKLVE